MIEEEAAGDGAFLYVDYICSRDVTVVVEEFACFGGALGHLETEPALQGLVGPEVGGIGVQHLSEDVALDLK